MKRWNTNSLEFDHEFFNNNMQEKISKISKPRCDRLKTCDLWLHAIDLTKILKFE